MSKRRRGRPKESNFVRVTPEFRSKPDMEKLGQALIAAVKLIAEQKRTETASLTDETKT